MKQIYKIFFALTVFAAFIGCDKADVLRTYESGKAPVLSASANNIAPIPADSMKTVLTLSWTSPQYGTDTSNQKFVVEIDSAGKNFSKPLTRTLTGSLSTSYIARELNAFLVDRGYAFNVPVDLDIRVISSYLNNNERLVSNTVRIKFTPYKVPPKIALPTGNRLYITGGDFGWSNTNPMPAYQELTRISETQWGGIFQFAGGQSYLLLPEAGSWASKYGAMGGNNSNNPNGDDFKPGGGDLLSPATPGWYKLVVDFQTGKFTVTPYSGKLPTSDLYIVGDATPGDWSNPVPVPSQRFTRVSNALWELTLPMNGNKEFLVLPVNGDWSMKYALHDNSLPNVRTTGEFGYHQDGMPAPDIFTKNFKGPATSGTYKISLNFAAPTTVANASGVYTIQ